MKIFRVHTSAGCLDIPAETAEDARKEAKRRKSSAIIHKTKLLRGAR